MGHPMLIWDWGGVWPRGATGVGRAGRNFGAGARLTLCLPPKSGENRNRAAGESHSSPTTAWVLPRIPPAIRLAGGRSPMAETRARRCSPPLMLVAFSEEIYVFSVRPPARQIIWLTNRRRQCRPLDGGLGAGSRGSGRVSGRPALRDRLAPHVL